MDVGGGLTFPGREEGTLRPPHDVQKYVGGKEGEVKNDQKAPGARFPQPSGRRHRGRIDGQPAEQKQWKEKAEGDPAEGARDCQRGPPGAKPGDEPAS